MFKMVLLVRAWRFPIHVHIINIEVCHLGGANLKDSPTNEVLAARGIKRSLLSGVRQPEIASRDLLKISHD